MLGGPPIMNPPVYLSSPINYPGSRAPTVASIPPGSWSGPKAATISAPASTAASWASQPAAPRPIFRAKGPDESIPAAEARILGNATITPLSMPTPEQLGIVRASAADRGALDWTAAHRQLERLGAIGFRFEKLETGGCR